MNFENTPLDLPPVRGTRITRQSENKIGKFALDQSTCFELGQNNIGVLLGGCRSCQWLIEELALLGKSDSQRYYLTVITKNSLFMACQSLLDSSSTTGCKSSPVFWKSGNMIFTTPENIPNMHSHETIGGPLACMFIVDPSGMMPLRLGYGKYAAYNRSKQIVMFQNQMASRQQALPMIYATPRPPKSLNTGAMLAPLGLDSWWFVDGSTVRIGLRADQRGRRNSMDLICL